MKKLIVWDLFGGSQNSVYYALRNNPNYELYTFDIITPPIKRPNQIQVDLTRNDIIDYLKQFPTPDIITSSPVCASFSTILSMKNGGTCFWKFNEDKTKLIERSIQEFEKLKSGFTAHFDAQKQLQIKRDGEKCINNTIKIIEYFKPKYWYIENPKASLMWKYIDLNTSLKGHLNTTKMGLYNHYLAKPTNFYSNIELNLKNDNFKKFWYEKKIDNKYYYVYRKDESIKVKRGARVANASIVKLIDLINAKYPNEINVYEKYLIKDNAKSEQGVEVLIPPSLINDIFSKFN